MNQERIYKVILGPHISEKTARLAESGQYVFKVAADATKPEIKTAVEKLFGVTVSGVQVLNRAGKTKRTVRGVGKRADTRKAYVRVAAGQQIEFVDVE